MQYPRLFFLNFTFYFIVEDYFIVVNEFLLNILYVLNIYYLLTFNRLSSSLYQQQKNSFLPGFQYYYPFLDKSCGLDIRPRSVTPLYKYMVNIHQPTMVLMGLIVRACLVVALDAQVSLSLFGLISFFTMIIYSITSLTLLLQYVFVMHSIFDFKFFFKVNSYLVFIIVTGSLPTLRETEVGTFNCSHEV